MSLRGQRLPVDVDARVQKLPRFRGVLAMGVFGFRTVDGGFRGESALLREFISVANSGGSDSFQRGAALILFSFAAGSGSDQKISGPEGNERILRTHNQPSYSRGLTLPFADGIPL